MTKIHSIFSVMDFLSRAMGEKTIKINKVNSDGAGGNWYHTTTKNIHCYMLCGILLNTFSQAMAKYACLLLQICPKFVLTLQESRIFNVSMSTKLKTIVLPNFGVEQDTEKEEPETFKINLRET